MASNNVHGPLGVNHSPLARKFGIDRHRKYLEDEQANHLCKEIEEWYLLRSLTDLCDDLELTQAGFSSNDLFLSAAGTALFLPALRWLSSEGYDFGGAYYIASTIFMKVSLNPDQQSIWNPGPSDFMRDVLKAVQENEERRDTKFVRIDASGTEVIDFPYKTLPRRIWDIRSNRVIPFSLLTITKIQQCPISRTWKVEFTDPHEDPPPKFCAVSHSWCETTESKMTPVNGNQWPVPLPPGMSLHRVRCQLSRFGAQYVWLDVLCLRQSWSDEFEEIRQKEWRLDVPTIGNTYRISTTIIRYFNGLGCDFSPENWDDHRHWLQRAWTLQELRSEDITYNGGVRDSSNLWNTKGKFQGKSTTLREVMTPLWELAEHLDLDKEKAHGEIYRLVREMSRRQASNQLDKVSGLFYLLRTTSLPTYLKNTPEGDAWKTCFHVLADQTQLELLFDFPYPGTDGQWFPSWEQLLSWPDRDPAIRHLKRPVELDIQPTSTFAGCNHLNTKYKRQFLFVKGLSILPNVTIKHTKVEGEYIILTSRLLGNSSPGPRTRVVEPKRIHFQRVYLKQELIPEGLYFLITPQPSTLHNWIVCEPLQARECMSQQTLVCRPPIAAQCIRRFQGHIFRKIGILRTDFVISLGGPHSTLDNCCECLFV